MPAALWSAGILVLTSWPAPPSGGPVGGDKVVHFALYLVLALLTTPWVVRSANPTVQFRKALCAVLLFAAFDELHQLVIPGRSASVGDFIADAAGASAGFARIFLIHFRSKFNK